MPTQTPAAGAPVPSDTDAEIIAAVRSGYRARFAELVRRHNQRLYRACRAVLGDDAEAEDAVQATWISAFRSLDGFRGDAAFGTWLTRIAIREAAARRRKLGRLQPVVAPPADDDPPDPERLAVNEQLGRLLGQRLDELPDGMRAVLVLRDVLELDTAETAAALGIGEEAVRVRLHRARHALARSLAELVDGGLPSTWRFDGERCARTVAAVMAAVREP
jgi:RNA polymerase sigma-70 factor, ECF subfamily